MKIRYFHCGEYGDLNGRPHYHALIFGYNFPDRVLFSTRNNIRCDTSKLLSDIWNNGFCTVGDVTYESAAYVARYALKKITGELAELHYSMFDYSTGEIYGTRKPEYVTMSRGRRPDGGIGYRFYKKFRKDFFPDDFAVINGREHKLPDYYLGQYEIDDPENYKKVKSKRRKEARKINEQITEQSLYAKKQILKAKLKLKERCL